MAADPDNDAALVARAIRGDQAAFGALARRHGPRMARTVRALGVSPSDVEDVTQGALLAAWRNLAQYDPARPFIAWIAVVAANKARDWRRHRKARLPWFDSVTLDRPEALAVRDPGGGSEVLEQRDELRRVAAAVARLPEHLRQPLILVTVTGLTHPEAAAALGLSRKTIETRIVRARRILDKAVGETAERLG